MAKLIGGLVLVAALAGVTCAHAQDSEEEAPNVESLRDLSIDELSNIRVTTVSRRGESLAEAPAATYVITREEIIRQGARTLPDILRLAPNLFVAQTSASNWVNTARGLAGNLADQAFSNKLLVLIDGRSVYTPLFSGVYWDLQDLSVSDIDHVEVISGPAGTLWGANAVNGVINIITRDSGETQGLSASVARGDQEAIADVRVGGALGGNANWRVYGRAYHSDATLTSNGAEAADSWGRGQAGFRLDWAPTTNDVVSFHGDAFKGSGESIGSIGGGDVYLRWNHDRPDGANLQAQAYISREQLGRDSTGGVPLWVNTYDLDLQQQLRWGPHDVVFGGGLRSVDYSIAYSPGLQFVPTKGTLNLANLFAQDTIALRPDLRLIVGVKAEKDPYSGWSALPNVRLAWTPTASTLVWGAVSRAIRSPTPFDRDVREYFGTRLFITGDPRYGTEKLTAYEAGVRVQPTNRLSLSVSTYYNRYDGLRSVEVTPKVFLPLTWGQMIDGHTKGMEAWGSFQATAWWRLSASVNLLDESFHFKPGASQLLGLGQVGNDPATQAMLKSSMRLGPAVTLDGALRYQSALPNPHVPAYTELNARIAWDLNDELQLGLIGYNLLHERHQEFQAPEANAVPRRILAELRWRF